MMKSLAKQPGSSETRRRLTQPLSFVPFLQNPAQVFLDHRRPPLQTAGLGGVDAIVHVEFIIIRADPVHFAVVPQVDHFDPPLVPQLEQQIDQPVVAGVVVLRPGEKDDRTVPGLFREGDDVFHRADRRPGVERRDVEGIAHVPGVAFEGGVVGRQLAEEAVDPAVYRGMALEARDVRPPAAARQRRGGHRLLDEIAAAAAGDIVREGDVPGRQPAGHRRAETEDGPARQRVGRSPLYPAEAVPAVVPGPKGPGQANPDNRSDHQSQDENSNQQLHFPISYFTVQNRLHRFEIMV